MIERTDLANQQFERHTSELQLDDIAAYAAAVEKAARPYKVQSGWWRWKQQSSLIANINRNLRNWS